MLTDQLSFIQVDYINTSHPNFLGGNKAAELAMHQLQSPQVNATTLVDKTCYTFYQAASKVPF